ncbi:hypothetical protein EYC80_010781 [Monilinia laxa]|uniref:Uncharacterized protein n=1 Tax=Monilinia laxa TaxID=61186 RepID=A0A5N6JQD7_MONLA|nr:hypothetical protein EYC80_010781 [Monilinia laxa]
MPTLEQEVRNERRVSDLLWKAISSHLELEKASGQLMKDIYETLERMKAAGSRREDWMAMCNFAQQLVNTLEILRDDGMFDSVILEETKETNSERGIKAEEESQQLTEEGIEEHIELLIKEMHPNLDQIRADAYAGLEKEDLHDVFGLAKQVAKPRKILGEGEYKVIERLGSINLKRKNKKSHKKSKSKKEEDCNSLGEKNNEQDSNDSKEKKEYASERAPKQRKNRKLCPRVIYNDLE